jgi:phosphatidylserine/phosphatidylglycerophosphate/cardiolipin synthase-like enzyme
MGIEAAGQVAQEAYNETAFILEGLKEEIWSDASDDDEQKLPCAADEAPPAEYSHVGKAAYKALASKHAKYKGVCWNSTHGKCVGEITQTPPGKYYKEATLEEGEKSTHSDFFPKLMGEVISRATEWVDFASLGPPDGKFLEQIAIALKTLADSGKSVTVRILTGNIIGMPTDNVALCQALTEFPGHELPKDSKLKIYVGSWRKGVSWNHSKIVAVDGKYLLQGGHNVWDPHYLAHNPVRDISMEAEGQVAEDGHIFCNRMWKFISDKNRLIITRNRNRNFTPTAYKTRVGIYRFPPELEESEEYPPAYKRSPTSLPLSAAVKQGRIPMISCGRYGELHHNADNSSPSDSAIVAMIASAKKSLKMSLQDLGPIAIPAGGRPCAVPGTGWPLPYLQAIGQAIYERGVDVEIVLSFPNSIPSDLSMTEANYGNGWTCEDVAAEIVKTMKSTVRNYDERRLAGLVGINLRVAYMRSSPGKSDWPGKKGIGNHAKFFIVDDVAYYIGSQNLYVCDLAEWGLIIDNATQTQKVLKEYWSKVWGAAYESVAEADRDMAVDNVLAGLDLDRNPVDIKTLSPDELEQMLLKQKGAGVGGSANKLTVWLKRANNLANRDGMMGASDPYAVIRVVDASGKLVKPLMSSAVVKNNLNPNWNEQFDFEGLDSPSSYTLKVAVVDRDTCAGTPDDIEAHLEKDDNLGEVSMPLSKLKRSEDFQYFTENIAEGWLSNSTVSFGLHNWNEWGT